MNLAFLQRDKLLHYSVMTAFAVVVFIAAMTAGAPRPHLCAIGSALLLAVAWELFWYLRRRKTGAPQNTPSEMALDIIAGMAGAVIVMAPVMITQILEH